MPYNAVLPLTGDLAAMGLSAQMVLESRHGFHTAVAACGGRRFEEPMAFFSERQQPEGHRSHARAPTPGAPSAPGRDRAPKP